MCAGPRLHPHPQLHDGASHVPAMPRTPRPRTPHLQLREGGPVPRRAARARPAERQQAVRRVGREGQLLALHAHVVHDLGGGHQAAHGRGTWGTE